MFNGTILANKVKTITLDKFIEKNNISKMDILKIDIEGNELYALKGGINGIKRFRPIIFCEINPELNKKAGYSGKELYNFIVQELRYESKILIGNQFKRISILEATSGQHNIFFFPL
ncbi:MAG: FkbM family methyltransferase [Treponema sp.]|jgi:hypothetical protein|nr:FkbM family methyltransferase [Treponema sp.]